MENEKICLNCNGVGSHKCAACNGTGSTTKLFVPEYGRATDTVINCPLCNGTGRKRCGCCYGSGILTDDTKREGQDLVKKFKKYLKGKAV